MDAPLKIIKIYIDCQFKSFMQSYNHVDAEPIQKILRNISTYPPKKNIV